MNKLTCAKCGEEKAPVEFRERKPGKRDLSMCRDCRRAYMRKYRGVGVGNGHPAKRRPFINYEG